MSAPEEADILFPGRPLTLNGETVTVTEFNYLAGLKAAAAAQPLLADLLLLFKQGADFGLSELDSVIGKNIDAWIALLALAVDKPVEWVSALSDQEGSQLSMVFWEINGPFLARRVAFAKQFGTIVLQPPAAS